MVFPGIDTQNFVRINRQAVYPLLLAHSYLQHVGQVVLTLRILLAQTPDILPQPLAVKTIHAWVNFLNLFFLSGTVLEFRNL